MLFYVVAIVPLQTGISLILATALNRKMRGMGAFRVIYYVPVITTIVAAALIFQFMFDRDYGVINAPLWWLGDLLHMPVSPPDWLNSSQSAEVRRDHPDAVEEHRVHHHPVHTPGCKPCRATCTKPP